MIAAYSHWSLTLKGKTIAVCHFGVWPSGTQFGQEAPSLGPFPGPLMRVGGLGRPSDARVGGVSLRNLPTAGPGPLAERLKMLIAERQLSEREQQLLEKSSELQALQKETDSMRADFSLLRNQFLTERKKAEKQVASLKEALRIQRSQLEKNLLVSTQCPGGLRGNNAFTFLNKNAASVWRKQLTWQPSP